DVRRILTERDIAALYRVLKDEGVTQRTIAALTGQSQSEVSEILAGRRVLAYDVLVRIAAGLGIPRELMGLSHGADSAGGEEGAYPGVEGGPGPEVEEEMRRRALLAATSLAALGQMVTSLGEVAELALPRTGDEPLPSRLGMSHVQAIEAVTEQLRSTARQYGGQAEVFGAAAKHYIRGMEVPATDAVQARLRCALAELHTEAGWACYDSGVDGRGYFTRALRLADEVGDGYGIVQRGLARRGEFGAQRAPQRRTQGVPARAVHACRVSAGEVHAGDLPHRRPPGADHPCATGHELGGRLRPDGLSRTGPARARRRTGELAALHCVRARGQGSQRGTDPGRSRLPGHRGTVRGNGRTDLR
ncbi:MAG: helix-turn-helix transcriptional regulator, partial [Geodermatophilaceae bacterium]